jgi:hypothetical protein
VFTLEHPGSNRIMTNKQVMDRFMG